MEIGHTRAEKRLSIIAMTIVDHAEVRKDPAPSILFKLQQAVGQHMRGLELLAGSCNKDGSYCTFLIASLAKPMQHRRNKKTTTINRMRTVSPRNYWLS